MVDEEPLNYWLTEWIIDCLFHMFKLILELDKQPPHESDYHYFNGR